jgi:hypothetical protein
LNQTKGLTFTLLSIFKSCYKVLNGALDNTYISMIMIQSPFLHHAPNQNANDQDFVETNGINNVYSLDSEICDTYVGGSLRLDDDLFFLLCFLFYPQVNLQYL